MTRYEIAFLDKEKLDFYGKYIAIKSFICISENDKSAIEMAKKWHDNNITQFEYGDICIERKDELAINDSLAKIAKYKGYQYSVVGWHREKVYTVYGDNGIAIFNRYYCGIDGVKKFINEQIKKGEKNGGV